MIDFQGCDESNYGAAKMGIIGLKRSRT
jgi:hypothetical protein